MDTRQDIQEAADDHYASRFEEIGQLLRVYEQATQLGHEQWEEDARQRLEEMPLDVSIVAIFPHQDRMTWEILLGTGGPADRVLVTTDFEGEIEDAQYEYQDWGTPWTYAHNQDRDLVEQFANLFWFSSLGEWIPNR